MSRRRRSLPSALCYLLLASIGWTRADAIELAQLTVDERSIKGWCSEPAWSPQSNQLAFVHGSFSSAHDDFQSVIEIVPATGGRAKEVQLQAEPSEQALRTHPNWSPDGEQLAFSTPEAMWILDLKSNSKRRIAPKHSGDTSPAWSPDGRQLAFESDLRGILDIWVVDVNGGNATRLTGGSSVERSPAWSPDGRKIAFTSNRSGNYDIWVVPVAGGYPRQITDDPADDRHPTWSPDGQLIAFTSTRSGNADVWIVPTTGGQATPLTTDPAEDIDPAWSPDGRKIAFASLRSGEQHIWVASHLPPTWLFMRSWQFRKNPFQ